MTDMLSKKNIFAFIMGGIIWLSVNLLYYLHINYNIGIICVFNKLTGLHCSGCGMTRAVMSLIKLDFYQAFRYNAFSIILLPIILLYFFGSIYAWLFNKENFINKLIPKCFWVFMLILLIAYGILRNIPYFSYLAPTVIR